MPLKIRLYVTSKKKLLSGFVFGLSFLVLFFGYGLMLYLASVFVRSNNLGITNAFSALFLIIFAAMMAGNNAKTSLIWAD